MEKPQLDNITSNSLYYMKSESKNKIGPSIGQSLDGPPLDFSFKGIHSL